MSEARKKRTVCLVVLVHVDKRVIVYVAVEVHVWPAQHSQKGRALMVNIEGEDILDPPIVPEIL